MEWRVVSCHGPDHAQKPHEESEACRPFGPIDDFSPDVVAVVRLRVVDRTGWEPDDENQDDDQVDDGAELVQPGN